PPPQLPPPSLPDALPIYAVMSGPDAEIRSGNALPLINIPTGTMVHNIELQPGMGGKMCRSAGTSAQLLARDEHFALLRMPSGEVDRKSTRLNSSHVKSSY